MDYLDREQLGAMAADTPELLLPILDDFHEKSRASLSTLEEVLASGNIEQARSLFHQLKGSSGTLGLRSLHKLCAHFESATKAGDAVDPTIPAQLRGLLDDSVAAARDFLTGTAAEA